MDYRLAERPGVRERAAALRSEMVARAVAVLSRSAARAAVTLWELTKDDRPDALLKRDNVRLNAAKAILASLPAMASHMELTERFEAKEQQLAELGTKVGPGERTRS